MTNCHFECNEKSLGLGCLLTQEISRFARNDN